MSTKPAGEPPRRYFTKRDFEKGLCDENGLALKPEAVKAQEKDNEPSTKQDTQKDDPKKGKAGKDGNDTSASSDPKEKEKKRGK